MERSIFQLSAPRGEFYEPPPSSEPILTTGYEIRPEFISMKLRDKFCITFFPVTRITTLRVEILSFQQINKELIGAVWSRFTNLVQSGPTLSIPDYALLQHFHTGLDRESAFYLDITAGGSFMHKTLAKGKEILDCISENTLIEEENFQAKDKFETSTLEDENSTNEHESFSFKISQDSCSNKESPKSCQFNATSLCEDHNHPSGLVSHMFRRLVIDAFIYHKYCKSRICCGTDLTA
uniref:B1292H11.23 protein n=1 Tax=Oryza sativa subsp. japonica TaxID=39947 RepID=Q6MWA8_ORYSJ|nr:B1292H11.23 [Oryza sativa Japonica Group]